MTRRAALRFAWWFALVNGAFFSLIGLRYVAFMDDLTEAPAMLYLAVAHWSHFTLLAGAALGLPLSLCALAWPRRLFLRLAATVWGAAMALLLVADTYVYASYRFHLRGFVVDFFMKPSTSEVFSFSAVTKFYIALLVAALLAVELGFAWAAFRLAEREGRRRWGAVAAGAFLLAQLATHAAHAVADAWYYAPITSLSRHLPVFQPVTAKRFLVRHGLADLDANRKQFQGRWRGMASGIKYPTEELKFAEPEKKYNIVYLLMETWRDDLFTPEVMPNIYKFSQRAGVDRYRNHFSGGNSTNSGMFSLFYSLPGNYYKTFGDAQKSPAMIDRLQKLGYQFGVFTSARIAANALDRTVFAGIDNLRLATDAPTVWERDARAVSDWIDWLGTRDKSRPFYGFIALYSPHAYELPPDYPQIFAPAAKSMNYMQADRSGDRELYFNLFKNAMHYADSQAGRIFADLEKRGELGNTIVVVTSDHAEEFNDSGKGYWGHVGNYSKWQIQVPLVISRPDGQGGGTITRRTTHLDLASTVMSRYLGCLSPPETYASGRGLDDSTAEEGFIAASYFNYAFVTPELIYIFDPDGSTTVMDQGMNVKKGIDAPPEIGEKVLKELSRFYK